jgi:hypothetical protein
MPARAVPLIGGLLLALTLLWASQTGDFGAEGAQLMRMPWGLATLADLYLGFALFACWVLARESHRAVAIAWIAALCVLGNVVAALYVWRALGQARGEARRFWLGAQD